MKVLSNLKSKFLSLPKPLIKGIQYFCLFILILILYELFYSLGKEPNDDFQTLRTLMIIPPIICFGVGCYLKGKNKLNIKNLTTLILIAGFALRIGYAFYTGVNSRQHDVEMGSFDNPNYNGHGHFSYIYIIYSTGKLPSQIEWQFYHPPLWHSLVALFMHIMHLFHPGYSPVRLFEEGIVVSSYVGCMTLIGFKELLFNAFQSEDVSLKNKNNIIIYIVLSLLAFHSQFFIMSSWMNNEGLSFMFSVFSLNYAIKFHNNKKTSDALLCGLMLGLGVNSKISSALIALPIGIILIYDLVNEYKKKNYKKISLQALSFILIVAPIATWFSIRNIIKFGVNSLGVPGIDPYTSSLGVIKYSYWQRFGIPNLFKSFNESTYCILRPNSNNYLDYNVWAYTLKCSVFGEYTYWHGDIFANILLIFNTLISTLSLICIIYTLIKSIKENNEYKKIDFIMLVIHVMCILSYVAFQILYPVTCTQDFRYMTLVLLPGAYFIARTYNLINDKKQGNVIKIIMSIIIIGFISFSILYFCSCR